MIAAEVADLILVPCRPGVEDDGILDLRAIGSTARILTVAGKAAFVSPSRLSAHVAADACGSMSRTATL
jgi:chromosome partitioning protein